MKTRRGARRGWAVLVARPCQGAFGLVGQQWDGRIDVSSDRFDGYRHHSASRRDALHADVGFQSGGVENRTYLSSDGSGI